VGLFPGKTSTLENQKRPNLIIIKIDKDTGKFVPGVTFTLQGADGPTIYKMDSVVGDGIKGAKFEIYVSKDKTEHGTYQKLDSTYYYTDANGIIHLDNLDTGWYKVVEVEPAAGFTIKEPAGQIFYVEHDKLTQITFLVWIKKMQPCIYYGTIDTWF